MVIYSGEIASLGLTNTIAPIATITTDIFQLAESLLLSNPFHDSLHVRQIQI